MVNLKEIGEKALSQIESLLEKKVEGIISVTRESEDWRVLVEVLERRAVPDTQDILSIYELMLTDEGELTGYKRIGLRRRADMMVEEEE
ncbi:MAG TPA: gas vesicle protein [Methanosarcinales archaeon]|nr:gas vesicle protein [Methanosarcinales archaeon]